MLQPVIFVGKAQSGKDTSCDIIGQLKITSQKFAFATPLKEFCHNVLGVEKEKLWGTNEQKNFPTHLRFSDLVRVVGPERAEHIDPILLKYPDNFLTGRQVLQYWGSDVCRVFYPDCWANATLKAMQTEVSERIEQACLGLDEKFFGLICDARFPNELECFIKHGFTPITFHLARNPLNQSHKSEVAFDKYDFSKVPNYHRIDNSDMTLEEKNQVVLNIMEQYL